LAVWQWKIELMKEAVVAVEKCWFATVMAITDNPYKYLGRLKLANWLHPL
jgi:hypothetical protein